MADWGPTGSSSPLSVFAEGSGAMRVFVVYANTVVLWRQYVWPNVIMRSRVQMWTTSYCDDSALYFTNDYRWQFVESLYKFTNDGFFVELIIDIKINKISY